MRVVSVIGVVTGLGLIGWAIAQPMPGVYIGGVILASGSAGLLLYRWQRRRSGEPGTGRRLRASGWSAAVAVLLAAVLIGVPYLARRAETQEGVIWSADGLSGELVTVGGTAYVTDRLNREVRGAVDLDDGSLAWSVPSGRWLTQEGSVIALDSGALRSYSPGGEQQWQFDVDGGSEGVDTVYAARDGYVVFASCSLDGPECRFVGIDPSGQQAWTRDLDVTGEFLGDWDGELLPGVVTVAASRSERGQMIDPATGDVLGEFPMDHVREQFVYGDVLVTGGGRGSQCRLDGYRVTDGEHLWQVDGICSTEQYVYPLPPRWAGSDALLYAVVEEDQPQSLLAVSVADGETQELPARDVGGSTSARPLEIASASAGELVLRWRTVTVTAAEAPSLAQRWQVEVPGLRVRQAVGDGETVAILSDAPRSGHNPMVPALADEDERHMFEYPTYVTVVDGRSGEVLSTTLVPQGVHRIQTLPDHRVLLGTFDGLMLIGDA